MAQSPAFSWQQTTTSLALRNGSTVVWQLMFDAKQPKTYFHPLATVEGEVLTAFEPADHPWHRGLWWSWKFINGVNYWEENPQTHQSDGINELTAATVKPGTDFSATAELRFSYHPPGAAPVMTEVRTLAVSRPDEAGRYWIDWTSEFTAGAAPVKLDRTPPARQGGAPWGGYAGLSLRFPPDRKGWTYRTSEGKTNASSANGQSARWVDLSGPGAGISVFDHPGNPRHPSPWYVADTSPLIYFSPALLFNDPLELAAGRSLKLRYRILVHSRPVITEQIEAAWRSFAERPAAGSGIWKANRPADCPFVPSKDFSGIEFTGRHSDYHCGDTWYPCWASDGNLYSPWTDGATDGISTGSGSGGEARTGHAVMIGDDPLKLEIHNTSPPKLASALPYSGRYPAGSLVCNGIWYYGTYCLGPSGGLDHNGFVWNWPNLGPMPGFQISRDYGKTWEPSPLTPEKPLFPEPRKYLGPVKMGAPHFVDFGKNMEHSPDGKAYLLGMGAEENDPMPRPCIKPGKPGEVFQMAEGCTDDFAHANLSWISADQVYLARVTPSPETINNLKAWEFFAGNDKTGKPVWTNDFQQIKPLLDWNNHMGCVTATYVPALKKYLMCVTDGWPTVAKMTSYILEADVITGPWRMVAYMKDFGEQGYFLNIPSKFISPDGRTMWLCYSANFCPGWNGVKLEVNPPGGRYGLCLHEFKLLK